MSPARPNAADDRLAVFQRGRGGRSVKRTDAHLETAEPVDLAAVPEPYDPRGTTALGDDERTDLTTCERAVAGLQQAFTVAGKALATINQARLYRETHTTFASYVEERWGMKRAHAYRLIEAWPIAIALSPRGDIPEKHVRAFLPVVKRHGLPAAQAAYEALQEQTGRVTTSRITEAVRALPPRLASPEQARDVILVAAAEGRLKTTAPPTEPEESPAQDDGITDAEVVGEGPRAVAILALVADRQRRLYDELGGGIVAEALTADPGRAEALLREIGQYANRTAYRARQTKPGAEPPSEGNAVGDVP